MLKLPFSKNQPSHKLGFSVIEVVVALTLILILGAGLYLYFKSQGANETAQSPAGQEKTSPPQKQTPSPLVTQPPLDQTIYNSYQTADQKFSFEYPQTWTQIELKNLESILPKAMIDKNELTMPLIASDPRGAQVILSIYHFDKVMDLPAIMASLEKDAASLGQTYTQLNREVNTEGDKLTQDLLIQTSGVSMKVRDLVYKVSSEPKNAIYNLSLQTKEENFADYESIWQHIENSVKITP